ncbi:MAG: PTS ascorbate-specific transporter subunit IIA [Spirochaeta sp. LUC14_002_19_P3]|nr:MAG: PTS ascorbate-specific transporter subunit IIA [Spirochaeta sp. LUC14_002_19_P3]
MAGFIKRLLDSGNIAVKAQVKDWEDAVRVCGKMMTVGGICKSAYVDAAVNNHKEIGPYYVIAPGIAMPHAKPENGVLKTGYALMTLAKPVKFGDADNDPVDLLIFAGAVNREEHNSEVVPEIAELCDSDKHIAAIRRAKDKPQLKAALEAFQADFEAGVL